jgi:hypothetical protein
MAIRSTIRYLFKKLLRGFQSRQSTHIESEADAPLESALTPSPKASNIERPQRFLRDRYQVNEKANIEYIDKSGSRTTRTILTEEVYEYSDGALVIRAYCYKRKNYRTFISSRVQLWTDIATGTIVTNLAEHLRAKSRSDSGNAADRIYQSDIVEINVAIGALVKYSRTKGAADYGIAGAKKMALVDYILNKTEVVDTLNALPAPEREDAKDSLAKMIGDTSVSDVTFEASKNTLKKSRDDKKVVFIHFIEEALKREPSQKSAIQIITDELIGAQSEKGKGTIPLRESPTASEVKRVKKAGANAKRKYQKKKREAERSKYYRSYERKNPVKLLAQEQAVNSLAEKANRNEEVFNREDFETEIVNAVSLAMTSRELAEEGDMFLQRCKQGISLGLLVFGLKKKNNGWYMDCSGQEVIDLRNATAD